MTDEKLHPEVEAQIQFLCSMHGGPTVGWAMAKDLQAIALLAASKAREDPDIAEYSKLREENMALEAKLAEAGRDAERWKRMCECAQNANSFRQDAIDGL